MIITNFNELRYFLTKKTEIKNKPSNLDELKFLNRYIIFYIIVPTVFIQARIINLINDLFKFVFMHLFIFHCMQGIFLRLQGFFNSLIFSNNYRKLCRMCSNKQNNISIEK